MLRVAGALGLNVGVNSVWVSSLGGRALPISTASHLLLELFQSHVPPPCPFQHEDSWLHEKKTVLPIELVHSSKVFNKSPPFWSLWLTSLVIELGSLGASGNLAHSWDLCRVTCRRRSAQGHHLLYLILPGLLTSACLSQLWVVGVWWHIFPFLWFILKLL